MTGWLHAVLDGLLVGGVLVAAALALFAPRRETAVTAFLVMGLLLAVVWALLGAPDVALAEAALAAGVTGALLLDAVTDRDRGPPGRRLGPRWLLPVAGGALAAVAAFVLGVAALETGPPGGADTGAEALGQQARDRAGESGVAHPVTAVLLAFRAYDTLLEVAVLALAVLVAVALPPRETVAPARAAMRRPVLDGLVRVVTPVVALAAAWLLVAGSTGPGGAFQAGALLAGVLVLLRLSGMPVAVPAGRWLRPAVLLGPAAFVAVAALGLVLGGGWLQLPAAWAGGVILALEVLLMASIGAGLAVLFVANQHAPDREPHR